METARVRQTEDFRTVDGSAGARRSGTRRIEGLHTEIASGNHGTGGYVFWTIGTHLADRLRAHFNQTLNLQPDTVRAEALKESYLAAPGVLEDGLAGVVAEVLERIPETFGRWRHFEQGVGEDAIRAFVDTNRPERRLSCVRDQARGTTADLGLGRDLPCACGSL